MPLQNRVTPFGELIETSARGTMFGNRGGKFHHNERTLGSRRYVSRRWICCVLDFKGRQRDVWGKGYTELFFLDEVTALAAGHRPCFECRRHDANAFAQAFGQGNRLRDIPGADAMDEIIHKERIEGREKRRHRMVLDTLPDGAVVSMSGATEEEAFAVRGKEILRWTPSGYRGAIARRKMEVDVLTPPSIVTALASGFAPRWHKSAG